MFLMFARVEHHLLAVDDVHAGGLEFDGMAVSARSTPTGILSTPAPFEGHDLAASALHEPRRRRHRAAHAEHAGAHVIGRQPVAIEAMMDGGRAEVPDDRLGATHHEGEAAKLVAFPLADLGGGDVAGGCC